MKVLKMIIVITMLLLPKLIHAGTPVSGNVSGTWDLEGSPYWVVDNCQVTGTLTIEPGVEVLFAGFFEINVTGTFNAVGTEENPIIFSSLLPDPQQGYWNMLYFENCNLNMDWWEISYAATGVYLYANDINWNPVLQNTTISDCSQNGVYFKVYSDDWHTIYFEGEIHDCTITNCEMGIQVYPIGGWNGHGHNLAYIHHNFILQCLNGIYLNIGSRGYNEPTINENTITQCNNGIYSEDWLNDADINKNIVIECENGIRFQSGGNVTSVYNNTISYCSLYGIKCQTNVYGPFKNNILYQNEIGFYKSSSNPTVVRYNCLYNDSLNFQGFPSTYGTNWITNANADSCDLSYNIMLDPIFVDSLDFNLTNESPCIDAGDPASPLDPDCTIADMGAFYYFQGFCPPIADFTSDITYGFAPLTVNFTDLSTHLGGAAIISWDWDFGDTFTDILQNPTHIYQDPGTYTVTLTVTDEHDSTDTEIKTDYITVFTDEPPAAPENVNIEIIGNDAVITWDLVDSTIYGNPIIVDYYLIFYSEIPYQDSLFFFLDYTDETTYTHNAVCQFSDNMFYQIVAYVGNIERINELIANKEKITLRELVSILEEDNINRNCKRK